jgi:glycosyltransferase involved in cell wall biosynthesis
MAPKVSVVIPTYNRPHLIERAIQSVLKQTYQNFEIIIIDDSSNDETEKVIKGLNDGRIKYIRNKIRKGNPGAKNQGVKESSQDSKYIAFLDDDDEYLPLFLEKMIEVLEKNDEIAAATSWAELRDWNGKKIKDDPCESKEFWKVALGNGCVIRKKIFIEENIWHDEKMKMRYEDTDFGIRVAKSHKWACIPGVLRICYPYPKEKGCSRSFFFDSNIVEDLEYFYEKHRTLYKNAGRKAEGWIHFIVGKTLCRAGKIKEGKSYLLKAFLMYPHPKYFFYYLLSLFFPKVFQNSFLIVLKHKIFKFL